MSVYVLSLTFDHLEGIPEKYVIADTLSTAIDIVYNWFVINFPSYSPVSLSNDWNSVRADFILYKEYDVKYTFSLIKVEEISHEKVVD